MNEQSFINNVNSNVSTLYKITTNENNSIITSSSTGSISPRSQNIIQNDTNTDDEQIQSNNSNNNSNIEDQSNKLVRKSSKKKRTLSNTSLSPQALSYHGINISQAAAQGNLPICVLLWGMAAAKRVNLMQSDDIGCNPMHYAAMADNPEVLGFINQQTRGLLTPSDLKLIDSRNLSGETPLLRSMYTGRMSVVKTLLDDGSDPFIRDNNGNTIIILCVKYNHLYCLHFLYTTIRSKYNDVMTNELFQAVDNDNHNALDWACYNGDVNIIEYLIRIGLSPYRSDNKNRNCLYWSVMNECIQSTRYLVRLGCNIHQLDSFSISPYQIVNSKVNPELLLAINEKPYYVPYHMTKSMITKSQKLADKTTAQSFDDSSLIGVNSTIAMTAINSDRINPLNKSKDSVILTIDNTFTTESTLTNISTDSTITNNNDYSIDNNISNNSSRNVSINPINIPNEEIPPLYTTSYWNTYNNSNILNDRKNYKFIKSNAIVRSYKSNTRVFLCLIYGVIIWILWTASLIILWYVWLIGFAVIVVLFRYIVKYSKIKLKDKILLRNSINELLRGVVFSNISSVDKQLDRVIDNKITVDKQTDKQTDRPIDRQTDRLSDRQIDNKIDKQIDRPIENISNSYFLNCLSDKIKIRLTIYRYKFYRFLNCNERYIGIYIGFYLVYCTIMMLTYLSTIISTNNRYINISVYDSLIYDKTLYLSTLALMLVSGIVWICLVWLFKDPGVIDTRQFDFNEIMEQSYRIGGAPPSSLVCRTTLIKKPLRSKYCSQLGVVIARMDHHCVWLNNSIGYKNHRLFMIFLYCHSTAMVLKSTLLIRLLNRQFLNSSTCSTLESIFSTNYFFILISVCFSLFVSLGLLALTIEQTYNICNNITTNERINSNRYNWLVDDNGNPYNRFNRGIIKNLLEFCRIPYYNVDYYNTFDLPVVSYTNTNSNHATNNQFTLSNTISSYIITLSSHLSANRSRSSSISSNASNTSLGPDLEAINS